MGHIGLGEAHMVQAGFGHACPGQGDRAHVAFHSDHLTLRANQSGCQHSYVSDAGTEIQDTLTWTNACFTE
jgi:hypothetical protein